MAEILSLDIQDNHSLESKTSFVGRRGEELAAVFLEQNGFRLIASNFKVPIGRNRKGVQISGEIDLIALDENIVCFIEVKTRVSDFYASPLSAIDLKKQRQIIRTARVYRKIFNLRTFPFRYDAVAVILGSQNQPSVNLYKNFWNEDKFRKKFWED